MEKCYFKTVAAGETPTFSGGQNGSISGYAATFDRIPDSYGDVIRAGAFLETLEARAKTGHPFPLCFNHDMSCIIGRVTEIKEDAKGLLFTAEFFNTGRAQEIREIVKAGVLWQFSFAYCIRDQAPVKLPDGTRANELRKLDLLEISVVTAPANVRAVMTDVKTTPGQKEAARKLLEEIDKIEKAAAWERNNLLCYIRAMDKSEYE